MALLKNRSEALKAYRYLRARAGPNVPSRLAYWLVVSVYAKLHSERVLARETARSMDAALTHKVFFYGII